MARCPRPEPGSVIVGALISWYERNARDLPWRPSTPWGVLVSEFMLQQTPVERVAPVWESWMRRWPSAPDLAAASLADAIRAWGRLGYPRRAVRLHECAVIIDRQFGGEVPEGTAELRALPGVGEYTAAAVQAFAFGKRSMVLDTNVRRVLSRALDGSSAQTASINNAERERSSVIWPRDDSRSARWSAAVMEFGAVVCRARPRCESCPITAHCRWYEDGTVVAPSQRPKPSYSGSDRQARGAIMQMLRDASRWVGPAAVAAAVPDPARRERVVAALVAEGLAMRLPRARLALPDGGGASQTRGARRGDQEA